MPSHGGDFCAKIAFEDPAQCLETLSLQNSSFAPTIFTGQKLRGALFISHDERRTFESAQLILRGEIKNVIALSNGDSWIMKQPLVLMSCIKVAGGFQQISTDASHTAIYRTSFFFDIPEFILLPSSEDSSRQNLPPSMRVEKSISDDTRKSYSTTNTSICDISYHIEARVFTCGRQACSTSREVIILPASDIPAPLAPEDLKGEYQLFSSSSLGSLRKGHKGATVVVSSAEPRPLILPSKEGDIGSTELFLDFKTGVKSNASNDAAFLATQLSECEVSITLNAITYFSACKLTLIMSVAEAMQSPLVVLKTTKYEIGKRKLQLKEWRRGREIASGTSELAELEAAASIITVLPENFSRLPSFFSAYISRRYSFDLEITFGSKSGMALRKPIKLRIPVQVIHNPKEKCPDRLTEVDVEGDSKAPPYVS